MQKKIQGIFLIILITITSIPSFGQDELTVSVSELESLKKTVRSNIKDYYDLINRMSIAEIGQDEYKVIKNRIVTHYFESSNSLTFNDIRYTPSYEELSIGLYLGDVRLAAKEHDSLHFSPKVEGIDIHASTFKGERKFIEMKAKVACDIIKDSITLSNQVDFLMKFPLNSDEKPVLADGRLFRITKRDQFKIVQINVKDDESILPSLEREENNVNRLRSRLVFINPSPDKQIKKGKTLSIQWNGTEVYEKLKVELVYNEETIGVINNGLYGTSVDWRPPKSLRSGDKYQILISVINSPSDRALSESFTLK